jgi:uncharacterized membrane protein YfhO
MYRKNELYNMSKRTVHLAIYAFFLPVILYLFVLNAAHVTPFGDNTLIIWDAFEQDSAFLPYWRDVLLGRQDLLYSFSRGMGGGMAGLIGFYLASPANLLLLLFRPLFFPLAYTVLILVRIGLCGLTFYIFMRQVYRCGRIGLLFSTSYAMMGMLAVYVFRHQWLDAYVLLPLVMLGIHRIVKHQKALLYLLSLGLTLWSNFYMGYIVCVFAVLYLIYQLILSAPDRKALLRIAAAFIGASLLAAGLAAVLLLPVALSLMDGYQTLDATLFAFMRKDALLDILTKAYTGAASIIQVRDGLPNYYIGIPLMALSVFYFLNTGIPLRRRMAALGFIAVMASSFIIKPLYYAWHAFEQPTYYPARFSFLLSFMLIDLSYQSMYELPRIDLAGRKKRAVSVALAFCALTAILFRQFVIEYLAPKTIVMDVIIFVATCAAVVWLPVKNRHRVCLLLLCAMQMVCLLLNSYYPIVRLREYKTTTVSEYQAEVGENSALVDRVQAVDDGLFRMELNYSRTHNDPMAYGYAGLTHSNSDLKLSMVNFAEETGFLYNLFLTKYGNGTTPVLESLLGIKYIIQKDAYTLAPLPDTYTALWTEGDATAYQNPYALPFGYLVPPQACDLSDVNPFMNQNALLSDVVGEETDVFETVQIENRWMEGDWEAYSFTVQAGRSLYMHSMASDYQYSDSGPKGYRFFNGTIALPVQAEDTVVTVKLTHPYGIDLAYFDLALFERAYTTLSKYNVTVQSDTDSHVLMTADVPAGRQQLMTTIPYDAGWRVWVDGKNTAATSRYSALLAVDLPVGHHTVEFRYIPAGLITGVWISGCSLLALLTVLFLSHKRNVKKQPISFSKSKTRKAQGA